MRTMMKYLAATSQVVQYTDPQLFHHLCALLIYLNSTKTHLYLSD